MLLKRGTPRLFQAKQEVTNYSQKGKQKLKFETSAFTFGHLLKIKQIHEHRKTAWANYEIIFSLELFSSSFHIQTSSSSRRLDLLKARQMVKPSSVSSKG